MERNESSTEGWSLREYADVLRRRRWTIVQTFVVIFASGVLATAMATRVFRAQGKLAVRAVSPHEYVNTLDTQNPLGDLLAHTQPETLATQLEVLQSEPFLKAVYRKAGLPQPAGENASQALQIATAPVEDTDVISVTVDSTNPALAARVANTMLTEYVDYTRDLGLKQVRDAKKFVERERERVGQTLAQVENNLLQFRRRNHVSQLTAEQENRTTELVQMEMRQRENASGTSRISAQLAEVRAQLAQEPEVRRVPVGRENPNRDVLETKLAQLETERAGLLSEYREHTPVVAALNAQIERIRRRLNAEPPERVTTLTTPNPTRTELRTRFTELDRDLRGLLAERDQLNAQVASKRARINQLGPWEIQMARLTRAQAAAEKSYLMLDARLQDLSIRENAQRADARILSPAVVPSVPIRPRKSANLLLAGMAGLVLGVAGAFLREHLEDRVRSPQEASRAAGLPVLGLIPRIPAHQERILTALPPRHPIVESYRALRSMLHFAALDHPLRSLLVASAHSGEGKSLTSLNLAIAMAMDGKRVVLVDADLRQPSLHRMVERPMSPGLVEVLTGTCRPEEVLLEFPPAPGLRVMASGELAPNPAELLNSPAMDDLIGRLTAEADVVLFDSPPCLAVTDAPVLATKVDGVLLVADIEQSRREDLMAAREQLDWAQASLVGIVLNNLTGKLAGACRRYYPDRSGGSRPGFRNGHTRAVAEPALPHGGAS